MVPSRRALELWDLGTCIQAYTCIVVIRGHALQQRWMMERGAMSCSSSCINGTATHTKHGAVPLATRPGRTISAQWRATGDCTQCERA